MNNKTLNLSDINGIVITDEFRLFFGPTWAIGSIYLFII